MAIMHLQCEAPKYDDKLPASAKANVDTEVQYVILWESYVNPRNSKVVYLSTCNGRYLMLPEDSIIDGTVKQVEFK